MNSQNKLLKHLLIIGPIVLTLSGCGGGSSSTAASNDSPVVSDNSSDDTNANTDNGDSNTTNRFDITEYIFDNQQADCASHVNNFEATVTDITIGNGFNASVTITASDDTCTFTSNAIPNHNFNDDTAHFANQVAEQQQTYQLPRNPSFAIATTGLSQQINNGIMLNGVIIDLLSAGCYDPSSPQASDGSRGDDAGITPIGCQSTHPWLADPMGVFHRFGADQHNAHTQPGGIYHYHGNPNALFDDNPGENGSPVIGFAADGFPIYGSYFYDAATDRVRKAESGYSLKASREDVAGYQTPPGIPDGKYINDWEFTNAGDLDECNGMTVNGQYGYYVIDEYPYIINCYRGTPHSSFRK